MFRKEAVNDYNHMMNRFFFSLLVCFLYVATVKSDVTSSPHIEMEPYHRALFERFSTSSGRIAVTRQPSAVGGAIQDCRFDTPGLTVETIRSADENGLVKWDVGPTRLMVDTPLKNPTIRQFKEPNCVEIIWETKGLKIVKTPVFSVRKE